MKTVKTVTQCANKEEQRLTLSRCGTNYKNKSNF